MFVSAKDSKLNRRRVDRLWSSLPRIVTRDDAAKAMSDLAAIHVLAGGHMDWDEPPLTVGFTIVFHGRAGDHGAHLSTPAFLHDYKSKTSMGSGSPFSYGHYHNDTLGPSIYMAAANPCRRGCKTGVDVYAGGILALMEAGLAMEESPVAMDELRRAADGDEPWRLCLSVGFIPGMLPLSCPSWPHTAKCLRLALEDETGTVFIGQSRARLSAWAEAYELSSAAGNGSAAKERKRGL